ncbi:DNA replication complex GINS protein PSF2 [Fasciolopsis buskii]|uniref:DNA replication complex GINS protein PSF2 n=1 Tax=Fasciolopsis buskii TaxID=27845 RepID=A0A8E0VDN5_9TREM|nr:DNA replication complex GINS protein PSF2 [Fasciolopsis buski]
MNPAELEFLAEDEPIIVIPRFKMEGIQLLTCSVGPLFPNIPASVPLWVALLLRQQQKCRIVPPDWLTVEKLNACKESEETDSGCTTSPHRQYMEIATLLLQHAAEDIQNPETVRTIVRDLWDIRVGKLVASVNGFISSGASTARVSHLTNLELTTLRNFLTNSMDQLTSLRRAASDAGQLGLSNSSFNRTSRSFANN